MNSGHNSNNQNVNTNHNPNNTNNNINNITNDNTLFSESELLSLMSDILCDLSKCTNKTEQFEVCFRLSIKYLHSLK